MNFNKKHFISILLLLIIAIIPLTGFLSSSMMSSRVHYWGSAFFVYTDMAKDLFEEKSFYLWSPYHYSGVPFLGHPETFLISLPLLLIFLLKSNTILAVNLTLMISFFLSGLGMYLLVFEFKKSHKAALIAAIVFMFNNAVFGFGLMGNISVIAPLSLMPFAFLFMYKAFHEKKFVTYSIISSLIAALQIHTGGMIIFLYTFILIALYAAFSLIGKNFKNRIIKIASIMLIFLIFTLALSAVKLLPTFEFQETSSRVSKFSYTEFLGGEGHYIKEAKDIFPVLVKGKTGLAAAPQIGFAAFLLVIISFLIIRNKKILFFALISIISVLIAANTFLTHAAYNFIPFFGNLKNIDRFLLLFAFSSSILAGLGYLHLEKILGRIKSIRLDKKYIFAAVMILLSFELIALKDFPATIERSDEKPIPILEFVSADNDLFRVHSYMERPFDLSHVVGSHGKSTFILYNLSVITGGTTIWPRDLGQYLFLAGQQKSAKLWGILNVKYIISEGEANIGNTKLLKEFEPCQHCMEDFRKTHVYENLDYLPKAYIPYQSILLLGNPASIRNAIYPLLFDKNFDPKKSVIIQNNKDLNELSQEYILKFDVVILTSEIPQSGIPVLKSYADSGGIILPDIFSNKGSITEEDIKNIFDNINMNFSALDISEYSSEKIAIELNGQKGFLVLSEMFSNFPGWVAKINGKETDILNANGIVSSIYLNGETGNLTLEYKPKSFIKGLIISSIAFIIILLYFSFILYKSFSAKPKVGEKVSAYA